MTQTNPMQSGEAASGERSAPKPKWLTPIAVSAIVFGSLFSCCGVAGIGGQLMNRAGTLAGAWPATAAGDTAAETYKATTERMAEVQAQIFPFALAAGALGLLHSMAFLYAGVMAYQRRESGRKLFVLLCAIGIGVEIISSGVGLYSAKKMSGLTGEIVKTTMQAEQAKRGQSSEPDQAGADKVASFMSTATTIAGIGFLLLWFLFKTAYFVVAAVYMGSRNVVQYFQRAPA